ncbi:MAG: hypothetical protein ACOCV8_06125 [Spirochaetota bacterium]
MNNNYSKRHQLRTLCLIIAIDKQISITTHSLKSVGQDYLNIALESILVFNVEPLRIQVRKV